MNIAIFTDYYLPTHGGVQTAIYEQKKALEAHGHNVKIVTVDYPEHQNDTDFILLKAPLRSNINGHRHRAFVPYPGLDESLARQIADFGPDIVHVQSEFTVGILGVRMARRLGVPLVYTAHTLLWEQARLGSKLAGGTSVAAIMAMLKAYWPGEYARLQREPNEPISVFWCRVLVASFVARASITISPSKHLKEKLQAWLPDAAIAIVPNFSDDQPTHLPLPKLPHFLWIGRLDDEKRPMDFVQAIKLLHIQVGDDAMRATMIGNGAKLGAIREELEDIPWAQAIGPQSSKRVSEEIEAASAVVLTSYGFDNQPMVIVEAIMRARGVVLYDSALVEGLDTGAGHYVDSPLPTAYADAMSELMRHPKKLQDMSDSAKQAATLFQPAAGYKRLYKVYALAVKAAKKTHVV